MITAFLDANILYPAPLRDLLLSLAEDDLFKPFWSNEINIEWRRNLIKNRPELDPNRIDRTIELMNQAFPDALVEGYEDRIKGLSLKDAGDRHVLAAALEVKAQLQNYRNIFSIRNNLRTLASTVHATLPIRTASQGVSFAF